MAGGTWITQNKIRPGAYINFKSAVQKVLALGSRGIVTLPVALSWGPQDTIVEITAEDFLNGKSVPLIGISAKDADGVLVREALKNSAKALIYRLDTTGVKAARVMGVLTATAKYAGILGNRISVAVIVNGANFDVVTYLDGAKVHTQTVANAGAVVSNDYITFSGTGVLTAAASALLTGGTNGSIIPATYDSYLLKVEFHKWNVMGIPLVDATAQAAVVAFIKTLRDSRGRKVQAVLNAFPTADYEGIISVDQGYSTADETIAASGLVAYVAGLAAGTPVNVSNTYHAIPNAIGIVNPLTHDQIEAALLAGKMVLSTSRSGAVVIEQDINTLKTFTADKDKSFSKNRVIRTLDEINNTTADSFESSFLGKVDSNADGRNLFKASIIQYMKNLEEISAIENFNSDEDVQIIAGQSNDSLEVTVAAKPVDSMEKLYMTVLVG